MKNPRQRRADTTRPGRKDLFSFAKTSRRGFIGGVAGVAFSPAAARAFSDPILIIEELPAGKPTEEIRVTFGDLKPVSLTFEKIGFKATLSVDRSKADAGILVVKVVAPKDNRFLLAFNAVDFIFRKKSDGGGHVVSTTLHYDHDFSASTLDLPDIACADWCQGGPTRPRDTADAHLQARFSLLLGAAQADMPPPQFSLKLALSCDFEWIVGFTGPDAARQPSYLDRMARFDTVSVRHYLPDAQTPDRARISLDGDCTVVASGAFVSKDDDYPRIQFEPAVAEGRFSASAWLALNQKSTKASSAEVTGTWNAWVGFGSNTRLAEFVQLSGSATQARSRTVALGDWQKPHPDLPWVIDLSLPEHEISILTNAGRFIAKGYYDKPDEKGRRARIKNKGLKLEGLGPHYDEKKFSVSCELSAVPAVVEGADFAPLHFFGTELNFVLVDAAAAAGAAKVLLSRNTEYRISLENAGLRLARSQDLLSLSYKFQQLDLVLQNDNLEIRPVENPTAPLIAVIFPPQHVGERAYFMTPKDEEDAPRPYPDLPGPMADKPGKTEFKELRDLKTQLNSPDLTPADRATKIAQKYELQYKIAESFRPGTNAQAIAYTRFRDAFINEVGGDPRKGYFTPEELQERNDFAYFKAARKAADLLQNKDREQFEELTEAHLSDVSRLVFAVSGSLALSVEALTNWRSWDRMQLVKRADVAADLHDGSLDLKKLLDAQKINEDGGGKDPTKRLSRIVASAVAPTAFDTAIELPMRLQLSPGPQARWMTPRSRAIADAAKAAPADGTDPFVYPLWHASLDLDNHPGGVRAIWSNDFRPGALDGTKRMPARGPYRPWLLPRESEDVPGAGDQWRTGMDAHDRHELVSLSSIHGLPALPRVLETGEIDGSQSSPPQGYLLTGLDLGTGSENDKKQAIYLAKTLDVNELMLTAIGGTLDLDTHFEPPAAPYFDSTKAPLFEALSIERWRQKTALGRDIISEVVYKGFLFPLGMRCSLVKITERKFFKNPVTGYMTAYLVQRMFIRISKPEKLYPAIGQPDAGRGWPIDKLTMLTKKTPDIVDPMSDKVMPDPGSPEQPPTSGRYYAVGEKGRVVLSDADFNSGDPNWKPTTLPGLIFWPKTSTKTGAEIVFQYRIDDNEKPALQPLLFVDNAAAHNPITMRTLARYYNEVVGPEKPEGQEPPVLGLVQHNEVKRRYAQEQTEGDASYLTLTWGMNVSGRSRGLSAGNEVADRYAVSSFVMTGTMEGADQPPFYPTIHWTDIKLKQLERMTAVAAKPVTASYDADYLDKGFDGGDKDAVLILRLKKPVEIDFGAGNAGDKSGGFAKPNSAAIGISRREGVVGRGAGANTADAAPAAAPAALPAAVPANQAKPSPLDLFGDAKILGLITFGDLLKMLAASGDTTIKKLYDQIAAPVMQEISGFADDVFTVLQGPMGDLQDGIQNVRAQKIITDLYPDIESVAKLMDEQLTDARKGKDQLIKQAPQLYQSGRQFMAVLERIAADPAAPVRDGAKRFIDQWVNDMLAAPEGVAADVAKAVAAIQALPNEVAKILSKEAAEFLHIQLDEPALNRALDALRGLDSVIAGGQFDLRRFANGIGEAAKQLQPLALDILRQRVIDVAKGPLANCDAELDRLRITLASWAGAAGKFDPASIEKGIKDTLGPVERKITTATLDIRTTIASLTNDFGPIFAGSPDLKNWADSAVRFSMAADLFIGNIDGTLGATDKDLLDALKATATNLQAFQNELPKRCVDLLSHSELFVYSKKLQDNVAALAKTIRERLAGTASALHALLASPDAASAAHLDLGWIPNTAPAVFTVKAKNVVADVGVIIAGHAAYLKAWLELATTIGAEADRTLSEIRTKLVDIKTVLTQHGKPWTELAKPLADKVGEVITLLDALIATSGAKSIPRLQAALAAITAAPDPEPVLKALKTIVDDQARIVLAEIDTAFQKLIDVQGALLNEASNALEPWFHAGFNAVKPAIEMVQKIDAKVDGARSDLLKKIDQLRVGTLDVKSAELQMLKTLLQDGLLDPVTKALDCGLIAMVPPADCSLVDIGTDPETDPTKIADADPLKRELVLLGKVLSADKQGSLSQTEAEALLNSWKSSPPVFRLAQNFGSVVGDALRGNLKIDLSAIDVKSKIEQVITSLIPTSVTTKYDFLMPLPSKKTSTSEVVAFYGADSDGEVKEDDLSIHAKFSFDVLKQKATTDVRGRIRPFNVELNLGGKNIITFKFNESTFLLGDDGKPKFNIKFASIEPGEVVKFVQTLQSYLSMSPAKGLLIELVFFPQVGIRAGYFLDLGIISFGTLSFINVSLGALLTLPFENAEALYTVALSRRDSPFLISCAPYGGGGFFSVTGNAKKVVGFEAAFEFGGVAGIHYGPLSGVGRLTTGIYIASGVGGKTNISGYFYAGGAASIACFTIAASLSVYLGQNEGGEMYGMATFTFSFSVGFAEIEFHVQVTHNVSSSGQKSAFLDAPRRTRFGALPPARGPIQLATAESGPALGALLGDGLRNLLADDSCGLTEGLAAQIKNNGAERALKWSKFQSYFDPKLVQKV